MLNPHPATRWNFKRPSRRCRLEMKTFIIRTLEGSNSIINSKGNAILYVLFSLLCANDVYYVTQYLYIIRFLCNRKFSPILANFSLRNARDTVFSEWNNLHTFVASFSAYMDNTGKWIRFFESFNIMCSRSRILIRTYASLFATKGLSFRGDDCFWN